MGQMSDRAGQDSYYLQQDDEDEEEVVEMDNSNINYNSREAGQKRILVDLENEEERTPEPRKVNPSRFASRWFNRVVV